MITRKSLLRVAGAFVLATTTRVVFAGDVCGPPGPSDPVYDDVVDDVKAAWRTAFEVFAHFGITGEHRREHGETRIRGNGGLLVMDDGETWYCFADEFGGGLIEAWGWCRFGSSYDRRRHFRQVLLEMAQCAGLDTARYYKRGDEQVRTESNGDRQYWSGRYGRIWDKMR